MSSSEGFVVAVRRSETHSFCKTMKESNQIWFKKFGEPDYRLNDYWGEGSDHMIWRKNLSERSIRFTIYDIDYSVNSMIN